MSLSFPSRGAGLKLRSGRYYDSTRRGCSRYGGLDENIWKRNDWDSRGRKGRGYFMAYEEDVWLEISGLEKFLFCRRQFALKVVEQQWADNVHTVTGTLLHRRAHEPGLVEARGDKVSMHALRVFSADLGVSGECDVVEFHKDPGGIGLSGREGTWRPVPVEYKKGHTDADGISNHAQLCCQAMCLESMLCCEIAYGFVYYASSNKRVRVDFTDELRGIVHASLREMHELCERGYTPVVKPKKECRACSLRDVCLPGLSKVGSVASYMEACLEVDRCGNC